MIQSLYVDIPRLYTALAQWLGCIVYISLLPRKHGTLKTGLIALGFLVVQGAFLYYTDDANDLLWLPIMIISFGLMYLMIACLCQKRKRELFYSATCAFLAAEAAAAIEWMIHYYVVYLYQYTNIALKALLLIVIYSLFFGGLWLVENNLMNRINGFKVPKKELRIIAIVTIAIFTISNLSYIYPDTPFSSRIVYEAFRIRAFTDTLGVVILFFFQLQSKDHMQTIESVAIKRVLRSQYDKYLYQQKSNEIISLKYHDLKHQIEALRKETDQKRKDEWLDSIEKEIDTYKNVINSGNNVLDSIIESKIRDSQKYNIDFTYVLDGKLLDFISVADICTIFGNALDNAIESEIKEPEQEKRMIHISVSAQRKMVCISIENYLSNPEKISVDNLKTTKKDRDYHGYGIKSVRYCVEKYQGNMLIKVNGNWFVMSIILPIPEQEKNPK